MLKIFQSTVLYIKLNVITFFGFVLIYSFILQVDFTNNHKKTCQQNR